MAIGSADPLLQARIMEPVQEEVAQFYKRLPGRFIRGIVISFKRDDAWRCLSEKLVVERDVVLAMCRVHPLEAGIVVFSLDGMQRSFSAFEGIRLSNCTMIPSPDSVG